nr:hypothetical protein [Tanacetum cinerariifolium]
MGMVSSIHTALSVDGSIRPEGFRPSILLLTVIIVTIAIVVAVVLVIVDTIIGIVVVRVPSIIKLAFVITGVSLGPVFLLRLSVLAIVAAYASSATSQELKIVYYHKLYDILKQHQNEVNEIRVERLARTANPLTLVAQQ